MPDSRLTILFEKYLAKACTDEERQEFSLMLLQSKHDEDMRQLLENAWEKFAIDEDMDKEKADEIIHSLLNATSVPFLKKKKFVRHLWQRISVAASVILAVGLGTYFLFFNRTSNIQHSTSNIVSHDIKAPATNRATITTTDGKIIYLDSAANGQLAVQNNVSLIKQSDGAISYQLSAPDSRLPTSVSPLTYNTLTNPRGSKAIDITLSDGSRIWLNAGSSITYPVAFVGNERKVSITGEAYFEVKHNEKMAFTVSANGVDVHDIGTSFNINAYDDEDAIKVTLIEGSIKVSQLTANGQQLTATLKPGEQNIIQHTTLNIQHKINMDEVMAWKDDRFYFMSLDIHSIMRQLSRWYNVEVIYESEIPDHFTGIISREVNVSEVIRMLQQTGTMKVRIEGNKIYVGK